jgi:hypothetical protein
VKASGTQIASGSGCSGSLTGTPHFSGKWPSKTSSGPTLWLKPAHLVGNFLAECLSRSLTKWTTKVLVKLSPYWSTKDYIKHCPSPTQRKLLGKPAHDALWANEFRLTFRSSDCRFCNNHLLKKQRKGPKIKISATQAPLKTVLRTKMTSLWKFTRKFAKISLFQTLSLELWQKTAPYRTLSTIGGGIRISKTHILSFSTEPRQLPRALRYSTRMASSATVISWSTMGSLFQTAIHLMRWFCAYFL